MNPMSGRGTRSKPVWRLLILRPPQRPREAESRKADTSNQRWRCSLKELRLGAARPNVINVQTRGKTPKVTSPTKIRSRVMERFQRKILRRVEGTLLLTSK